MYSRQASTLSIILGKSKVDQISIQVWCQASTIGKSRACCALALARTRAGFFMLIDSQTSAVGNALIGKRALNFAPHAQGSQFPFRMCIV